MVLTSGLQQVKTPGVVLAAQTRGSLRLPQRLPSHRHTDGNPLRTARPAIRPFSRRSILPPKAALDGSHLQALSDAVHQISSGSHNLISHLADAEEAVAAAAGAASDAAASDGGWFGGLANLLESFLKVLEQGLTGLHVPYAYGFSIILLTFLVKAATFPLTKKQVESTLAMQTLAPKQKAIQAKFAGDQERIQLETARLYKQAGVNPLAGCLPTLATLPVWIGLYQALSNVAKEGVLTEGFFWIPSLAGPASIAARDSGSGLSWLFPLVDGAPPLGWGDTARYLVLPVLLVASQYYSMQILQPPTSDDPAQKNTQLILKFLPIMIGWFALSVPSGLSLYWFTNNVLSTAQTVYLRQGGGASPAVTESSVAEILDPGQAKRTAGQLATQEDVDTAKGERFRKLKEAELERKAAKRAAEEAAKSAALQALKERESLKETEQQQQGASAVAPSTTVDGKHVAHGEEDDEDDEEEEHSDGIPVPAAAPAKVSAGASMGAADGKPIGRRSKRSRRTRKV